MTRKLSVKILNFLTEMMAPILLPVFWISKRAFKLILGPVAVRMSKESDEKLGNDVLSNLGFLFDDHHGRVLRDETVAYPRPFDYAFVIVALDNLSFRFIRGRGEFRVQIAPKWAQQLWEELPTVLRIIDETFEQRDFASFNDVGSALRPRMSRLQEFLSAARYPELQEKLSSERAYERAVIRQWETEINRRLYGNK